MLNKKIIVKKILIDSIMKLKKKHFTKKKSSKKI
jgi:hypothetical protein